ncbi:E3 SUMO-protein ligase KIAA1586-like [Diabrotica virgifera virgifera]|uniref:E3 SUMO-protein ligase KIAA1586-like n=1 Tax=Diabrotica virgifera virgifera TaxID=50390 RepID=A0ABM5KEC6_DIAVI|nr:E3 SUMO-protein ligase KIAA1586-like [Diabrotica virgifera virgifera]
MLVVLERAQQQTSLRKKIFDHKVSDAHEAAVGIFADSQKETLEKVFLKTVSKEKEAEIAVQELNGLDMGRILHSRNACANIITHISSEMEKQNVQEIVEGTDRFALIIDESTTLSKKSTLILYLRVCLKKLNKESPVHLFLDLVELENVTSRGIFNAVMKWLEGHKIDENVLKSRLVALACDGVAVMLGGKSGIGVLLKEKFPSIVICHFCNHRLELCVSDVVKKIASINRFKGFIDKLYVLYHASPKNSRELHVCADELGVQLLKIGRVLNTRWVASSFRTVSAVWENYEVLANHFAAAKVDQTCDPLER